MKTVRIQVQAVLEAGKWFNSKCEPSTEDFNCKYFVVVKESYLKQIAKRGWISTHYSDTWENVVDHDICNQGRKLSTEEVINLIGNSVQFDCLHHILFSCLVSEVWKIAKTYEKKEISSGA